MRVSSYYNLGRKQPYLDFVDVDIQNDVALFVDPLALRVLRGVWRDECVALMQDYFESVLDAIKGGKHERARNLLGMLKEPNETHLGLSKGRSRGRGLGLHSARDVWQTLLKSDAVTSGLLIDLEDAALMVEGISADRISDMTTNVIREPLIKYTQAMCAYYNIPMEGGVDSGPLWSPSTRSWTQRFESLPVAKGQKILLVPKVVVRSRVEYDFADYYDNYIMPCLIEQEVRANTELVHLLRDGTPRVTKKDLRAKYGSGKAAVVRLTREHPELLEAYRKAKRQLTSRVLDHDDMGAPPELDERLKELRALSPGNEDADAYNNAVEKLLSALFYPALTFPHREFEIHEGRKRIDITYTNEAHSGFFGWLHKHYAAAHIFVECKNYSTDPKNPEIDQLSGRFSPSRGRVGILVCRTIDDRELLLKRCHDTAADDRGFIVPLDDDDLTVLVEARKQRDPNKQFVFLKERFDALIM